MIRVGGTADGAYLIPDHLEGVEACFSPGVDNRFEFERELANRSAIPSFMCDGSINSINVDNQLLSFGKKWLLAHSDEISQTLEEWLDVTGQANSQNLILQMDIEGWEYLVMQAVSYETLKKFRIILLELHGLERLSQSRFLNLRFIPVLKKLREKHDIVHLHPNNACGSTCLKGNIEVPNVLELTFYRRNENTGDKMFPPQVPHPLDIVNNSGKLPLVWDLPLSIDIGSS